VAGTQLPLGHPRLPINDCSGVAPNGSFWLNLFASPVLSLLPISETPNRFSAPMPVSARPPSVFEALLPAVIPDRAPIKSLGELLARAGPGRRGARRARPLTRLCAASAISSAPVERHDVRVVLRDRGGPDDSPPSVELLDPGGHGRSLVRCVRAHDQRLLLPVGIEERRSRLGVPRAELKMWPTSIAVLESICSPPHLGQRSPSFDSRRSREARCRSHGGLEASHVQPSRFAPGDETGPRAAALRRRSPLRSHLSRGSRPLRRTAARISLVVDGRECRPRLCGRACSARDGHLTLTGRERRCRRASAWHRLRRRGCGLIARGSRRACRGCSPRVSTLAGASETSVIRCAWGLLERPRGPSAKSPFSAGYEGFSRRPPPVQKSISSLTPHHPGLGIDRRMRRPAALVDALDASCFLPSDVESGGFFFFFSPSASNEYASLHMNSPQPKESAFGRGSSRSLWRVVAAFAVVAFTLKLARVDVPSLHASSGGPYFPPLRSSRLRSS